MRMNNSTKNLNSLYQHSKLGSYGIVELLILSFFIKIKKKQRKSEERKEKSPCHELSMKL